MEKPSTQSVPTRHGSGIFQSRKRTMFKSSKESPAPAFSPLPAAMATVVLDELEDGSLDVVKGWTSVLSAGDSVRRDAPVVGELVRGGAIPAELRGDVYMLLCGGRDEARRYAPCYFDTLMREVESKQKHVWSSDIEKDLLRTLPGKNVYQEDEKMRNRLRGVLTAFSLRTPSVGYCQSMNVICGSLLLLGLSDEQAFWVTASLVEQSVGYYTPSMTGLETDQLVLDDLIKFHLPWIYSHFEQNQMPVKSFAVAWFMLLFIESPLTFDQGCTLLPFQMLYGDVIRFHVTIGILRSKSEVILALKSQESTLKYFLGQSDIGKDVDLDSILTDLMGSVDLDDFNAHVRTSRHVHRREVIRKRGQLNHFQLRTLKDKVQFDSDEEINDIWKAFLAPNAWDTLTQSCLAGLHNFLEGFLPLLFLPSTRRAWRGDGIFSETFARLHRALDVEGLFDDCLSFIEVVDAIKVFSVDKSEYTHKARMRIAGNFLDQDRTGEMTRAELCEALCCIHSLYQGRPNAAHKPACINMALVVFRLCSYDALNKGTLLNSLSSDMWREIRVTVRNSIATYPAVLEATCSANILSDVWEQTAVESKLQPTIKVADALGYMFLDPYVFEFFRLRYHGADQEAPEAKLTPTTGMTRIAARRAHSEDQTSMTRTVRARSRHRPKPTAHEKLRRSSALPARKREGSDIMRSVSNWFDNFLN
jgi:hypothetical protein